MSEFTFVARASDSLMLCETWSQNEENVGNDAAKRIARDVGVLLGNKQDRGIVELDNRTLCYTFYQGVVFGTVKPRHYPPKVAFAFLDKIRDSFMEYARIVVGDFQKFDFRSKIETLTKPYQFISFDRKIAQIAIEFRNPNNSKAFDRLNESLTQVSDIMRQNVDEILSRGENLQDVARKAENLQELSKTFYRQTQRLQWHAFVSKYGPAALAGVLLTSLLVWRLYALF